VPVKPGAGRTPATPARPTRIVWPFVLAVALLGVAAIGLGAWLLLTFLASRQPNESGASAPPTTPAIASPSAAAAPASRAAVTAPPRATAPPTTLVVEKPEPARATATTIPRRAPTESIATAAERGLPAPPSTRTVRVGGQIKEPKKLTNVSPSYPEIAKQARVQGIVILECVISPQGNVTEVKVLRGIPLLDQAAIDAVKQWVYAPTLLNGVPVAVIMTVTVNFKLS
jgi:TonB family protein